MSATTIQGLDFARRCIVIISGFTDSFGKFHPNAEEPTLLQHPSWSAMTDEEFEQAATADILRVNNMVSTH